MTREETLKLMGELVATHLSAADANTVARALLDQPERMIAYLNADKRKWVGREFAHFALRCAKRVYAGGAA